MAKIKPRTSSTPAADLICWEKCGVKTATLSDDPEKPLASSWPWAALAPKGEGTWVWGQWEGAVGLQRKLISRHPTHTHIPWYTLYLWTNLSPVLYSSPLKANTHTPCSLHPRANIISFSDRWDISDLVENEATNLHPYYTVIHAQLQTCMWKLTLPCTMLSRVTQTATHFLSLHVKESLNSKNLWISIHPSLF